MARLLLSSAGWMFSIVLLGAVVSVVGLPERAIAQGETTVQADDAEGKRLVKLAEDLYKAKQYDQAIDAARKAITFYESRKDDFWLGVLHSYLGIAYYDKGDYKISVEAFQQSISFFEKTNNQSQLAEVWLRLGGAYRELKQYPKAIEAFQKGLVIIEPTKNENLIGQVYNWIGVVYYRAGQYQQAIEAYQKSLVFYQKSDDKAMNAQVLFNLGEAHLELKQYSQSIEFFKNALLMYAQLKNNASVGNSYYWIGKAYRSLKQYRQALDAYRKALPLYEQLNNQGGIAQTFSEIADMEKNLGQYEQAILSYRKAISLFSTLKQHEKEGYTLNSLAYTYLFRNKKFSESQKFLEAGQDVDLAIIAFQQSLEKARQSSNSFLEAAAVGGISTSHVRQASIHQSSGNAQKALQSYLEAIKNQENALLLFTKIGNPDNIQRETEQLANYYSYLATIYNDLGQYQQSIAVTQKARLLYEEVKYSEGIQNSIKMLMATEMLAYFNLANLDDMNEKNHLKKIELNKKVIDFARQTGYYEHELLASRKIADIYLKLGKRDKALIWLQKELDRALELSKPTYAIRSWSAIGKIYEDQGKYNEALAYYSKSFEASRSYSDVLQEAQALSSIASIYKIRGEFQKSIANYQKALEVSQKRFAFYKQGVNNHTIKAFCLENGYLDNTEKGRSGILAYQCRNLDRVPMGQVLESIQQFVRNQEILAHQSISTFLNNLANVYSNQGNYAKSLELYQQSNEIDRAIQPYGSEVVSLANMANAYTNLGDLDKALSLAQQALKIAESEKTTSRIMEAKSNLGKIHEQMGKPTEALALYHESLRLAEELDRPSDQASILQEIGGLYFTKGDYARALEFSQKAYQIVKSIGEPLSIATALGSIGSLHQSLGQYNQALNHQYQALEIVERIGAKPDISTNLLRIASTYRDKGNFKQAADYYQKALTVAQSIDEIYWLSRIRVSIANLELQQRQPGKALELVQQALTTQQKIGVKRDVARTLSLLGEIQAELNQSTEAQTSLQKSIALAQQIGDRPTEAQALANLAALFAKQNQPELAIVFYKKSVNTYESIRQNLRTLAQNQQQSYTETIADTYRQLAQLLIEQKRLPEAQAVLELLKLRELKDYTRDVGINTSGISLAKIEEAALKQILEQFTTINNFTQAIEKCRQEKCSTLDQLYNQRDRLNTSINKEIAQHRDVLRKHFSTEETLSIDQFNDRASKIVNAQPGTVLIYPLILKNKIQFLIAFKAGNGAVTFRPFEQPVRATELFNTIQEFRKQLSHPGDLNALKATSQKLYNWLIKPLEAELNQPNIKHIVLAPDSVTRYIPFAALYDGQQYLIQRYSLSTINAATTTDVSQKFPKPSPNQPFLLAMGASLFPKDELDLSTLYSVPSELDAIVRQSNRQEEQGIYPGSEFLNEAFNYEALKNKLEQYQILHIATHGKAIPGRFEESFLVAGDGKRITPEQIQTLKNYGLSNIHLVVLSACETAVGDRNSDGIEIPGLSQAFLGENATKSVLASLWSVNDDSTALMMMQFYQNLAPGNTTKAAALQQVQKDFITNKLDAKTAKALLPRAANADPLSLRAGAQRHIKGQPPIDSYAHPYYWAPFTLIGNSL